MKISLYSENMHNIGFFGIFRKALLLLKKKKYLEKNIEKAATHLNTIQNLIDQIEFAEIQVKVLDGLRTGNEALKSLQKVFSLDDAERIMSDAHDSAEYQKVFVYILKNYLALVFRYISI